LKTIKSLIEPDFSKLLLIIFAITLFSAPAASVSNQPTEVYQPQLARQAADDLIAVAIELYKRNQYQHAERALLEVSNYNQYLTALQREELQGLLEKTHTAVLEQAKILKQKQIADDLIRQDRLLEAKAHLENAPASAFLTEEHRSSILESIGQLNERIKRRKKEVTEIYKQSVKYFNADRLEEARGGFIKVAGNGLFTAPKGKTAEDYLLKIDKILTLRVEEQAAQIKQEPVSLKKSIIAEPLAYESPANVNNNSTGQVTRENYSNINVTDTEPPLNSRASYKQKNFDKTSQKDNILKGYIEAVINDASAKAQDFMSQGRLDDAIKIIEGARRVLDTKHSRLGDVAFEKYSERLEQLIEYIDKKKINISDDWDRRSAWKL
jgi:hypothetical protein